jgi:predicted nuclease of predicted toxin-antitoxin system
MVAMRRVTTFNHVSDFQRQFASKARFLIDESVGMEVARLIRDRGWNVCYVDDVGLLGRSDEEVLAFAWKEQRILLTYDFDFLDFRLTAIRG